MNGGCCCNQVSKRRGSAQSTIRDGWWIGESMADAGLETMRMRKSASRRSAGGVCVNVMTSLRPPKLRGSPNHVGEMEL
jgi:hypothetical protein